MCSGRYISMLVYLPSALACCAHVNGVNSFTPDVLKHTYTLHCAPPLLVSHCVSHPRATATRQLCRHQRSHCAPSSSCRSAAGRCRRLRNDNLDIYIIVKFLFLIHTQFIISADTQFIDLNARSLPHS